MGSIDVEPKLNYVTTKLPYKLDPALGGTTEPLYAGTLSQYRRKWDHRPIEVYDMRGAEEYFKLDKQGFEVFQHSSCERDFIDEERIKSVVYDEVRDLMLELTGATRVHIFSHLIRRHPREFGETMAADSSRPDTEVLAKTVPSTAAHIDQSEKGCIQILQDNMSAEEGPKLQKTRWGIINLWRPIKTVHRDPLCVCDSRTVVDEDLVQTPIILPSKGSGSFENVSKGSGFHLLEVLPRPEHRWYYTSNMRPDEALLLKIYDSTTKDDVAKRVPHTSFRLPGAEKEDPRESIEFRALVFWENEPVE